MDQTQRRLMLLLPLFFVIFIISFPAGLILYCADGHGPGGGGGLPALLRGKPKPESPRR